MFVGSGFLILGDFCEPSFFEALHWFLLTPFDLMYLHFLTHARKTNKIVWRALGQGTLLQEGDMKNLYSFIQGSFEWPISELFPANVLLWNQYIYIAFSIFSCRVLIILYKMLIITGIFNEKTKSLTIYEILSRNVTIIYRKELASLLQVQKKSKACRISKLKFPSSCLLFWLHIVFSSKHHNFHFRDNVHLFKYYPVKVPQNCFSSFNCSAQACIQISEFSFSLDK